MCTTTMTQADTICMHSHAKMGSEVIQMGVSGRLTRQGQSRREWFQSSRKYSLIGRKMQSQGEIDVGMQQKSLLDCADAKLNKV